MNLEEKAKYTKHAREVWDNYFSTAPTRIPKPRKQTKLVIRCSPGRLYNVLQRFTQKDAIKSMGLGSLLGLRCRMLHRSVCLWVLERFNISRRSLEICDKHILLTPKDVEMVMGLTASGKDVVNSGPDDPIADVRLSDNATNSGISVCLFEERLAAPESGEDFKRSFVLYALGTLLSPIARLDEVSRFRQGKQHAVGGCLLFLQLFYYERVSIEGFSALTSAIIPSLSSWGEDEISAREKHEKELGGYGCGEVYVRKYVLVQSHLSIEVKWMPHQQTNLTMGFIKIPFFCLRRAFRPMKSKLVG